MPPRLSPRENTALNMLLERPGRAVRKDALLARVFPVGDFGPDALDVVICRLRKKLLGGPINVVTLRGIGYVAHVAGQEEPPPGETETDLTPPSHSPSSPE